MKRRVYLKADDFKVPKPDTPRVNAAREEPTRDFINAMARMERELAEVDGQNQRRGEIIQAQREYAGALEEALRPFAHDEFCRLLGGQVHGSDSIVFSRNGIELRTKDFLLARMRLADCVSGRERGRGSCDALGLARADKYCRMGQCEVAERGGAVCNVWREDCEPSAPPDRARSEGGGT